MTLQVSQEILTPRPYPLIPIPRFLDCFLGFYMGEFKGFLLSSQNPPFDEDLLLPCAGLSAHFKKVSQLFNKFVSGVAGCREFQG